MENINLQLLVENALFFFLSTAFFFLAGWRWREAKPYSLPEKLSPWFRVLLGLVLSLGIILPLGVLLYWGFWQGYSSVREALLPYFLMLGLQILAESTALNYFRSPIWVAIPCVYLPYRLWQLQEGLNLVRVNEDLFWVQVTLVIELVLWTINYAFDLSQLPLLLRWDDSRQPPEESSKVLGGTE